MNKVIIFIMLMIILGLVFWYIIKKTNKTGGKKKNREKISMTAQNNDYVQERMNKKERSLLEFLTEKNEEMKKQGFNFFERYLIFILVFCLGIPSYLFQYVYIGAWRFFYFVNPFMCRRK